MTTHQQRNSECTIITATDGRPNPKVPGLSIQQRVRDFYQFQAIRIYSIQFNTTIQSLSNLSRRSPPNGCANATKASHEFTVVGTNHLRCISADVSCQSHVQRCCWYVGHANWWYQHTNAKHNPIKRTPNARASAVMITADNESLRFACWTPVASLWTKSRSGDRRYGQISAEHLAYSTLGTQLGCEYAVVRFTGICCAGYDALLLCSTHSRRSFND